MSETATRRCSAAVRATAQAMPPADRRAYLLARGWRRLGGSWLRPEATGDRGFYSLAAATYVAVEAEQEPAAAAARRRERGHP